MTGYDAWLMSKRSPISESLYAVKQWELILMKPFSITIKRGKTTVLAAQTVRVEFGNEERVIEGASGAYGTRRDIVVFGVKGHPSEDIADTNIQKSDIFVYEGRSMKVLDVVMVVGGIQANCEAIS